MQMQYVAKPNGLADSFYSKDILGILQGFVPKFRMLVACQKGLD